MAADFLNADLEITSDKPLDSLCREVGDRAFNLFCGSVGASKFLASFEIDSNTEDQRRTPDELIRRFCDLFEGLSHESMTLWNAATSRVIDLGYEANDTPERLVHSISMETMRRLCDLKVEITFTVYPKGITP